MSALKERSLLKTMRFRQYKRDIHSANNTHTNISFVISQAQITFFLK